MSQKICILGDIGGTNARFCMLNPEGNISAIEIYQVRENPTLIGALSKYIVKNCAGSELVSVALAVAGPVLGDVVPLTNSDWVCDKHEIEKTFALRFVHILNDFEAVAVALTQLIDNDLSLMQVGCFSPRHPRVIMGPGTGLGIAALKPLKNGQNEAITTEAGHIRYAPANDRERNMMSILSRSLNYVSQEDLISGPGLVRLYQANCALVGEMAKQCKPSDVVDWARAGDKLCQLVLDDFSAIFGSIASSMALSYIALGGVYLTGGVLEKIGPDFNQKRFMERFLTNPKMSGLLSKMPVYRVTSSIPAFSGLKIIGRQDF